MYGAAVSGTVLVTGGTKGVGRGIVERFAADGWSVMTCGRNAPEPSSLPEGVAFTACDVRDPGSVSMLVTATVERFGSLDVAVNNAGGSPEAAAATASPRFFESIIRLNLLAPMYVAQAANAVMQDQADGGVIVNIGSVSGIRPSPGTAAYGAAKAGLVNVTATLAMEWAPKVRVVCITVGLMQTEQTAPVYGDDLEAIAATVPLGRMATPADVASAVVWAVSPEASYLSGSNVVLHGGGEPPTYRSAITKS
jgi:NAD(P)-dependent dehydrogenase (short-subunit alcohol dehydrogenase family)